MDFIDDFAARFPKRVDEYETLLTDNRIWKQRTVGIGVVSPERATALGFTGPMLRGSGVEWDLRKKQPYEVYEKMQFKIPIGLTAIATTVFLCAWRECVSPTRLSTMRSMVAQKSRSVILDSHKAAPPSREIMKTNMEELIHHFKLFTEGMHVSAGEAYCAVEHPKASLAFI